MGHSRPFFGQRKLSLTFLFYLYSLYLNKPSVRVSLQTEFFHQAAVATDIEQCSDIGIGVLSGELTGGEKGNAVDAAVAAALCSGVMGPASSGIGGGSFMLLRLNNGTAHIFDMRETAPMDASKDMYHGDKTLKSKGALSIAVPGQLAGLHEIWKQYGTLKWEKLVMPAANLAENGFKISAYLYSKMSYMESDIFADPGFSEVFTSNGALLPIGSTCYNKKLAETLRTISKDGIEPFYHGSIGENLIKDIQERGGIMKMSDLKSYEVRRREPISVNISGMNMQILGMPPPSAGGAGIVLMLNILDQYNATVNISDPLWAHRMVESMKNLFAIRMNIGDPDYVDCKEVVHDMLSPEFAETLRKKINDNRTYPSWYYGGKWNVLRNYLKHENGTSHFSIIDAEGNAVAMTNTLNYYFGSTILSPRTGIILNNEMDDFSMPEDDLGSEHAQNNNYIEGGKRPLSSMSPTIMLKDKKVKAIIGASGGTTIIPAVVEVLLRHYDMDKNLNISITAPRLYHQLIPDVLRYENFTSAYGERFEVPDYILKSLKEKGHVLQSVDSGADCQAIILNEFETVQEDNKLIVAICDPRKGGFPAGY